jgi:hypothetical protein
MRRVTERSAPVSRSSIVSTVACSADPGAAQVNDATHSAAIAVQDDRSDVSRFIS